MNERMNGRMKGATEFLTTLPLTGFMHGMKNPANDICMELFKSKTADRSGCLSASGCVRPGFPDGAESRRADEWPLALLYRLTFGALQNIPLSQALSLPFVSLDKSDEGPFLARYLGSLVIIQN